ncbi:unnamed protein product [Camellia sinensis]
MKKMIALGFEGSANKIGVRVVTLDGSILSNPRQTHLYDPQLAMKGEKFIDLPYVVKGIDVLFSGILSYLEATAEEKIKKIMNAPLEICAISFSVCFRCLWRLMAHTNKKDVLIAGCTERLFVTDDMYCVDNGAMIVYTGLLAYANGMSTPLEESTFTQRFRTDEVLAIWRERKRILQMVSWKKVSSYLNVSRDGKEVHTILEYSWIQLGTLAVISQNHKEMSFT